MFRGLKSRGVTSQIRKIQRRYTACHGKVTSKDKEQILRTEEVRPIEIVKPNPKFNREKAEEDRKLQTPQEIEIGKENEEALIEVSKKLLGVEEAGFDSFELAIKEEEMSQKEGKELIEAMLAEQQEEDGIQDIKMSDLSDKAPNPFEEIVPLLDQPTQKI